MKKQILGLVALAPLVLAGCAPSKTSLMESSSTPPTSSPTTSLPASSPSTPVPSSSSPEPSSSTPEPSSSTPEPSSSTPEPSSSTPEPSSSTTPVDPSAAYKIDKAAFVSLLVSGLTNCTVKATGFGSSDGIQTAYLDGTKGEAKSAHNETYFSLSDGILTYTAAFQRSGTIVYPGLPGQDFRAFSPASYWEVIRGSMLDLTSWSTTQGITPLGDAAATLLASALYDSLIFNETTHAYEVGPTGLRGSLAKESLAFENGKITQLEARVFDDGDFVDGTYDFSDIGTTEVTIPQDALARLAYHKVTFYEADGTTPFAEQFVGDGGRAGALDTFPQKTAPDADNFYYCSGWTVDGGKLSSVTQDIKATPVFTAKSINSLFTISGTTATLGDPEDCSLVGFENQLGSIVLPASWTVTTLNLHNINYYPNLVLTLAPSITEFTDTNNSLASHIDISKNTHFVEKNSVIYTADKTTAIACTDLSLSSVSLDEATTSIFIRCFAGSALTSMAVPEGVTNIGANAFNGCSQLTSLTLPTSITTIGLGAFQKTPLTSFDWPTSVADIPDYAFNQCWRLTSISLPSGVTSIGTDAFCSCGLTTLTLPDSASLGFDTHCFESCLSLTKVTVPASVTSLGMGCFYNDAALSEVVFEGTSACEVLGYECFYRTGLTSITLPASVAFILGFCFEACLSLTSVDFSACTHLTEIPEGCFWGCESLTSVSLPSSVVTLGDYCFGDTALTNFTIDDHFTSVGAQVFMGCEGTGLVYGGTGAVVEDGILYVDSDKKEVNMGFGPLTSWVANPELESVDPHAFDGLSSLTSIDLSEVPSTTATVTIGERAFAYTGLASLSFPATGTTTAFSFGDDCFTSTDLKSIAMPSCVKALGEDCFSDCESLTSVDLSKAGITALSDGLFSGDSALESVILPTGITSIGSRVFANCSALKAIYLMDTTMPSTTIFTQATYAGTGWNCLDASKKTKSSGGFSSYAPYYLYSETTPSSDPEQYWHYVNGVPTVYSA